MEDSQPPVPRTSSDESLASYRKDLITAEQKAQADFDKTVLTLSGGALGVSFAFVKQFVGSAAAHNPGVLMGAWGSWVLSVAAVLVSHYFSTLAMRKAIEQVDRGTIRQEQPGGNSIGF